MGKGILNPFLLVLEELEKANPATDAGELRHMADWILIYVDCSRVIRACPTIADKDMILRKEKAGKEIFHPKWKRIKKSDAIQALETAMDAEKRKADQNA